MLRGPGPVQRASVSKAPSLTRFWSTPSGVGRTVAPKIKRVHILVPRPVNMTLCGKSVGSVIKSWVSRWALKPRTGVPMRDQETHGVGKGGHVATEAETDSAATAQERLEPPALQGTRRGPPPEPPALQGTRRDPPPPERARPPPP